MAGSLADAVKKRPVSAESGIGKESSFFNISQDDHV